MNFSMWRLYEQSYIRLNQCQSIPNEQTLNDLVAKTQFQRCKLESRTMNHSKRLVMHLHKGPEP